MRIITSLIVLVAIVGLAGCVSSEQSNTATTSSSGERWTGVVAVQESAEVWRLYDSTAGDLTRFAQLLEAGLDNGTVQSATGRFDFIPYAGGQPAEAPFTVNLRAEHNGTWYFQGPAAFFQPGRAMCVRAASWPLIATQRRFPAAAGPNTNCIDFGPQAALPGFANSNHNAATIVMVQPAG